MHSKILILDFGSQVTQLIARRVRDAGVFSEVFPYDVSDEFVKEYGAAGVILSGGPNSVIEGDTPRVPQSVFELGVPVLGICYGMQAMAEQLGGKALVDLIVEESVTCYEGDRTHRHPWGYGCGHCPACELRAGGYAKYTGATGNPERMRSSRVGVVSDSVVRPGATKEESA